jgi:4-amino-4-deoxy-L-arabinose transferase-like glycosyltransferase
MALKPEVSIGVGLATAALVYSIYSNATPTVAAIRAGAPHDPDIDGAERAASWTAAGVVAGVSLIAKDPTIFVLGGSMVIAMAWIHRHANMVNPDFGSVAVPPAVALQDVSDGYEAA